VDGCPAGSGADTIQLASGTYTLTLLNRGEDAALTGDLDITQSVTIVGNGASYSVVDGNGIDRVFHIHGPAVVTISGLTIQNGNPGTTVGGPEVYGGGISIFGGGSLTLNNAILRHNTAYQAGGLVNNGGMVVLNRVTVYSNTATYAGGLYNSGYLTLVDTSVGENRAIHYGGGLHSVGDLTLSASTVNGNSAGTNGGGLYLHSGNATLLNSTVSGNRAASWMGGGVWVYYQVEVTITHSTIVSNTAGVGAGIYNFHQQAAQGVLPNQNGNIRLKSTIIAHNTLSNCARNDQTPAFGSLGYNLSDDLEAYNTCELSQPNDLINTLPNLGPLQNNGGWTFTHALLAGSPAIDVGSCADANGSPVVTDQRGFARPQGTTCDIGAFEYSSYWLYLPLVVK
jgi:hypothetical protein